MGQGSGCVTAVAQVAAVVWVLSLAQELPHALGTAPPKGGKPRIILDTVVREGFSEEVILS